jgi:hypothetical protein
MMSASGRNRPVATGAGFLTWQAAMLERTAGFGQKRPLKYRFSMSQMSKRRIRQEQRMPLEEKVRLLMVDLFRDCGSVNVEAHDHDDIQGLVVMVNLSVSSVLRAEDLSGLLNNARTLMHQLVPPDHRLHEWVVSINQGELYLGSAAF